MARKKRPIDPLNISPLMSFYVYMENDGDSTYPVVYETLEEIPDDANGKLIGFYDRSALGRLKVGKTFGPIQDGDSK